MSISQSEANTYIRLVYARAKIPDDRGEGAKMMEFEKETTTYNVPKVPYREGQGG